LSVCGFAPFGYPLQGQVAARPYTLKMRFFSIFRIDTYYLTEVLSKKRFVTAA